jgi:hypothetical protein
MVRNTRTDELNHQRQVLEKVLAQFSEAGIAGDAKMIVLAKVDAIKQELHLF